MNNDVMLEALTYAGMGWSVFPVRPGGKAPLGAASPHGVKDATTDLDTIRAWWEQYPTANVGVAAGASGLYIIDVDAKDGTRNGLESWAALEAEHGASPTYTVRTPSGGLHLYYLAPVGVSLKNTVGGPTGEKGLGSYIDTRGVGGYVVAPPSRLLEGAYEVLEHVAPAPLPQWVVDSLEAPQKRPEPTVPVAQNVKERVRQLADSLHEAPVGERNNTLASIAYMVGQYVGAGQIKKSKALKTLTAAVAGWDNQKKTLQDIERQLDEGFGNPRAWVEGSGYSDALEGLNLEDIDSDTPTELKAAKGLTGLTDWGTDAGQARRMLQTLPDYMYVMKLGWVHWNGKVWEEVDKLHVVGALHKYYQAQHQRMVDKFIQTSGVVWSERAAMYRMWLKVSRTKDLVEAMAAQSFVPVTNLDRDPELLNTPDGVVNLRTGEVGPHDRSLYMTKITKGSYRKGYQHPDWNAALEAIPKPVRPFLQARLGQALTGYMAPTDDALILIGNGANGKSLLASDGVFPAMGDYAAFVPASLVVVGDAHKDGPSPEKMMLRGTRLALIEELPEGKSLSIAELKRVTGTSTITARAMRQDNVTFNATHTLVITTNYLPSIRETDDGTWRRLTPVNFPFRFVSGSPCALNERVGDIGLKHRVSSGEGGQYDAAITWMVEGSMKAFSDTEVLSIDRAPVEVRDVALAWRAQSDRIHAFLTSSIVADSNSMVSKIDLYLSFTKWLEYQGSHTWTQETFFTRLKAHSTWIRLSGGAEAVRVRNLDTLSRPSWGSAVSDSEPRHRCFTGVGFLEESPQSSYVFN